MNQHSQNAGDLHELAPLYAVDALEPAEREEFEQHLADCPRCQAEVAEYAEVTAGLAAETAQTPPPALRSSVLSSIHGTQPLPGPWTGPAAVVVSLEERRRRRGRRLLAAAAAAVLLPGIGLAGWNLGVQSEQREQEQQAAQEQDRETRLLAAPDVATQRVDVNGQPATLVVSREEDAALFVADTLPDPGEGREYQLWLLEGETPIPDTHFSGGDVSVWLSGDVAKAGAVALTVEPAGGSATPTFPLVAVAEI
ncbi:MULTISPECIES: anti-sigma factor domain-containing protein [unclassified Arthrobacter]|uniref:anti-sigma factor n=1 Tax=unclassified Arthrobacter TaxID=235627 RepID=UPI0021078834|nr:MULTISPECIES: anti-sigma factor [unclassified Arthrobacter]MCQ1987571.1 anti-sigma factor [Arthrobacter sp. zg-Y844]MCQ1996909.1 anti-sigma factor [Arthrobacter sp. zg-Y1171]UWX82495.1 anti-sigma factor [Arthrobacter sp. zg-Y1171]